MNDNPPGRSAIGGIARSGSANLLAAGVGSVANLLIIVVITRGWPPALAGAFLAVTSIFLVSLALVELGVDQGFVRFQARNLALGRLTDNRRILRAGYASVLCTSLAATGLLGLLADPMAGLIADPSTEQDTVRMVLVVLAGLPVASVYDLLLAQTRGRSYMRPTILIERICRPTLQLLLLTCVVLVGWTDPALLAAAWVGPYAVGLAAVVFWVRTAPAADTAGEHSPESDHPVVEFWRFTAPRGVARVFQVGLQRADIAIVSALAGPAATAIYAAATRFLVVGQVATQALQQVSEPHLARLMALDHQDAVRSVYHQLTLWSIALTWPLYLLVAVFAEPLVILVFGPSYAPGGMTLTILALTMLFATAMGPVDVLLLMSGRSTLSLINTGAALIVDVAGCLLLVPPFGIEGAAVAWAAAIVGRNVLGIVQVRRHLKMTPLTPTSTGVGVTGIAFFAVAPATTAALGGGVEGAVTTAVVGTFLYAVVIWRHRESLALSDLVRRRHPHPQFDP